jgi:hypothetical protein
MSERVGIFTMTPEHYHADPASVPSLTASIAHLLVSRSPLHAWTAHPRLNPAYERREDDKFDVGNVAHAVILEGRDIVYVVHADSWRTKDAKESREYARSIGKVPLLATQREAVDALCDAVRQQIEALHVEPPLFSDGSPEQTLVWEEDGGIMCRARLDWLRSDLRAVDDLKTTSRSAHPVAYARRLYDVGGDIQAAFYLRGVRALTGATPVFRWVVAETEPPYAISVITPGADVLALGEAKVEHALGLWRRCLETGEWPGYPSQVHVAELPAWEEARWIEREEAAA